MNHDSPTLATPYWDGELSLFDASGVAEPRLITPPLPAQIGYTYFSIHDPVAPMFRPPNGDQIVGVVDGVISVVDIDGTHIEGFVSPSLTDFREAGASVPDGVGRLAWSRDGSLISFMHESDLFVMNADGSDLRRFETEFLDRAWSPDGSKIALEKPVTVSGSAGSVIAILDVETGAERVLEATSAVEKQKANRATDPEAFRTDSIRTYHKSLTRAGRGPPMGAVSWFWSGTARVHSSSTSRPARSPSYRGRSTGPPRGSESPSNDRGDMPHCEDHLAPGDA